MFKITIIYVAFVFIPIIIFSINSFNEIENKSQTSSVVVGRNEIYTVKSALDKDILSLANLADLIANNNKVKQEITIENMTFQKERLNFTEEFSYIMNLNNVSLDDIIIYHYSEGKFLNSLPYKNISVAIEKNDYTTLLADTKSSSWIYDKENDVGYYYYLRKIKNSLDKDIGIISVRISEERILEIVKNTFKEDRILLINKTDTGNISSAEPKDIQSIKYEIANESGNLEKYFKLNRDMYVYEEYAPLGLYVINRVSISDTNSFRIARATISLTVSLLVLFLLMFYFFLYYIFRKLNNDLRQFTGIIDNGFVGKIQVRSMDELGRIETQFNILIENMRDLISSAVLKEKLIKNAQLSALQNQMDPHFIYNAINGFRMQLEIDGNYDVAESIAKFGKLLRYHLLSKSHFATLSYEFSHLKDYIDIKRQGVGEKSLNKIVLPSHLRNVKILKFILQPIVENSFKYGKRSDRPLEISVSVTQNENLVFIAIEDNGNGMKQRDLEGLNGTLLSSHYYASNPTEQSSSIGLKNINERLKLLYDESYHIRLESVENEYFRVIITIPYENMDDDNF